MHYAHGHEVGSSEWMGGPFQVQQAFVLHSRHISYSSGNMSSRGISMWKKGCINGNSMQTPIFPRCRDFTANLIKVDRTWYVINRRMDPFQFFHGAIDQDLCCRCCQDSKPKFDMPKPCGKKGSAEAHNDDGESYGTKSQSASCWLTGNISCINHKLQATGKCELFLC